MKGQAGTMLQRTLRHPRSDWTTGDLDFNRKLWLLQLVEL